MSTNVAIEWQEPAPNRRGGGGAVAGRWVPLLQSLQERPGTWARIREYENISSARSAASNLRRGIVQTPPGIYEYASRSENGVGVLYAVYHGEEA